MPDLDYAKVVQRLGLTVGDTPDDLDDNPDTIWCDGGTVQIVPLNTYVKVADGSPVPWTGGNAVIECAVTGADFVDPTVVGVDRTGARDGAGYLLWNGKPYVWVVDLSSPKVNPFVPADTATHQVVYLGVTAAGTAVSFPPVDVRITAAGDGVSAGAVNDLTILSPVVPGAATPIFVGPQGDSVAAASIDPTTGDLLFTLDDVAATELNAGPIPVTEAATTAAGEASTSASSADTAAATATTKAGEASTSATDAAAQKAAAETARTGAETARTGAEAARDDLVAQKGAAGGIAPLGADSKLPETHIPDRLSPTSLLASIVDSAVPRGGDIGRGGRGMVSITLDDGVLAHFTDVLPISKTMGFPIGTAWVTDNGNDAYVADAYAAGWEILAHTADHSDATTLSDAALKAQLESSIAKIAAITGSTRNIGFVYPYHFRNTATDLIVSRYHPWGRGQGLLAPINEKNGHSWVVASLLLDGKHDASGNLTDEVKQWLRTVAANDAAVDVYFHYTGVEAGRVQAIVNFVNYARSLGTQIVRPSDVRGVTAVSQPNTTTAWTLDAGTTISSAEEIKTGDPSFRITPNAAGGGALTASVVGKSRIPVGPNPGKITIYRAWLRYKNPSTITFTSATTGGFRFGAVLFARNFQPQLAANPDALLYGSTNPTWCSLFWPGATTLATQDWGPFAQLIAVGPEVNAIWPAFQAANVAEAVPPFDVTDIRFDKIDVVSSLTYVRALAGTTGVTIKTNMLGLDRCGVSIAPQAAVAGRLHYSASAGGDLVVKSTDAADTALVSVTVHPGMSYINHTLSGSLV